MVEDLLVEIYKVDFVTQLLDHIIKHDFFHLAVSWNTQKTNKASPKVVILGHFLAKNDQTLTILVNGKHSYEIVQICN